MIMSSESVTGGHPDKVADFISDGIVDACLAADPGARVACETLVKGSDVILAGEITTRPDFRLDVGPIVRDSLRDLGYDDPRDPFHADGVRITQLLTPQSTEIRSAVDAENGAGDQGLMFGYATDETPELMPLPILLAHRLALGLSQARRDGRAVWLRPDGKTQVSVEYTEGAPRRVTSVLVSAAHAPGKADTLQDFVVADLLPGALAEWHRSDLDVLVNPGGDWTEGGPAVDAGLTGRKTIVDTYGGVARHGGGAFSGKDPTKVDRSGAYFCRWVARRVVEEGLAKRAEVQVAYAMGRAAPVSVSVETFGTGDSRAAEAFVSDHDFRPAAIIERLGLARPIYRTTTNYGHFGRPGLPWESAEGGVS